MKVIIDAGLCEGNAVCEALAPMVFELDANAQAQVIDSGDEYRSLVERAAEGCPRLAIHVDD